MSNPRKAKGSSAERDVVNWLKKWFPYAERRIAGAHLDKGDIAGVNGVVAWTGAVLHKRSGKGDVGEWYATMPVKIWIELIRKILNDK